MVKALVTGCAGFVGSQLCERLLADGHEVVGIDSFEDYYPRAAKERNLAEARRSPRFRLVEANLLDLALPDARARLGAALPDLVSDASHVFHLAAQPGVRASWGATFETYSNNNVLATQLMLEAAKQAGVGAFVYASSSSVYGDTDEFPMREDARCRPYSPYGVTKLAAENLCQLYWRNFGVPTVSLRFFTVYGPRQRPDMAFHRFLAAMVDERPIEVYGDGAQTRDFTFVGDILDGITAAPSAPPGSILNLGGGSRVSLLHTLDVLGDVVGRKPVVVRGPEQAGDVRDTSASIDRARELIGYEPKVSLADGLRAEYEWLVDTRSHE
jgi:nucleoside-diphosphate-sugar epimerase